VSHVSRNPLGGGAGRVWPLVGVADPQRVIFCVSRVTSIDEHRRPVWKHHERGVAAAGNDLMNIERAGRPRREHSSRPERDDLTRRFRGERDEKQSGAERGDPHWLPRRKVSSMWTPAWKHNDQLSPPGSSRSTL
jgi:hypothetical protein